MTALAVQVLTAGDLDWPFRDGRPRLRTVSTTVEVDPFPAYRHDEDLVRATLTDVAAAFAPRTPLTVHVADFEDVGRTNGWAAFRRFYWRDGEDEPTYPWHADIFLSGKRIPPHPAVTRYVVAHEYGHQVQWWLEHDLRLDEGELLEEYAQLRGHENGDRYGGGRWHASVGEIFACDFRIIVAGIEPEYWPHAGADHPSLMTEVCAWWASHTNRVQQAAA